MGSIIVTIAASAVLLGAVYGDALADSPDCSDPSGRVHMTVRGTGKPTEFKVTSAPAPCGTPSAKIVSDSAESTSADGKTVPMNHPGQSWGGKLRKGPGMEFSQVGSLVEGAPLTIVSNSGVRFNDYDWFEIRLPSGKTAFQWGGILCSVGDELPGVFGICPSR